MALEPVTLEYKGVAPCPRTEALVEEASRRIDLFFEGCQKPRYRGFIPSDHLLAYRALRVIADRGLSLGNRFCEWGSGYGVATCLAAQLGYQAFGVEIEEELVRAARSLAADFDLSATFVCDTYLPSGFDFYTDPIGDSRQLIRSASSEPRLWEQETGLAMEDLDVVYVYPWPGDAQFVEDLFEATASDGALLLSYHENGEMVVKRRVSEEDEFLDEDLDLQEEYDDGRDLLDQGGARHE
jgi:hypothetical protein